MRALATLVLIFSAPITNAQVTAPYPISGKSLYAVNMAKKACNEIVFGLDQKFRLQTEELGVLNGTYEYANGILTMHTTDKPVFLKLKFQKYQESDGKLGIIMENLVDRGVVNMYGNQKFCEAVKLRLVRINEASNGTPKEKINSKIEHFNHATLKERLDIGPALVIGNTYKVTSLYGELYDGLCKPITHRSGKELCDDVESLIKNIRFDFSTSEGKATFYRNKKSVGCFTFVWSDPGNLRIVDYQLGVCS